MAELTKTRGRYAFSGWPMIIAWAAMLLFAFHSSTRMVAAGDTWVAMACGRHFINHGVDTVEPFSANSHKAGPTDEEVAKWPGWAQWITHKIGLENMKKIHPTGWVNQNWLTHVIFYWLTHLSPVADAKDYSFNTLVYWKISLYILSVTCIYYTGRILGVNPALAAVFACFAMFAGRSFLDIRPAGFSNLLVAVFLLVLVLATYRNILYLWLVVPMTVFWCNVHGGYIYVFIMLAAFFGLHILARLPVRWTTALYCTALWMAGYILSIRFLDYKPNEYTPPVFQTVDVLHDKLLYLILLLAAGSIALAIYSEVKPELFYGYHLSSTLIIVIWSFARFFREPQTRGFHGALIDTVRDHISGSQLRFLMTVSALICLGLVLALLKDRLLRYSTRQLVHVGAVGMVTFAACTVFNPFHLTNFTHTFVISVSKHAEMWRTVHEWHPAFAWDNPVGTGFPYMVMVILIIGAGLFWLLGRFMSPDKSGFRHNVTQDRRRFAILSTVFGCAVAIFVCYVLFVSLSFCPTASGLAVCILFVGVILLSVLFNIHLLYALVPIILIVMEATKIYVPSTGRTIYPGTYIYPFIIVPTFVGVYTVASLVSEKPRYKYINIIFVILTAIAAIMLMSVIINPLKFKAPSETGGITNYFEQFLNIRRPWKPPYESNLGLLSKSYDRHLFTGLYIANILSAGIWLIIPAIKKFFARSDVVNEQAPQQVDYELPKFDVALMVVVLLTVYMAYRSRRFIPIAGFAACPVLAMFINQITETVSASLSFYRNGRFVVPSMSGRYQGFFAGFGVLVLVVFGTWCGLKFKRVYLNPWPMDARLNSVFMRMSASHAKPFWAMQFIKENNLSGNMFNYWTEGGFIAYGQRPDPNTGKTPLQLFMDGRAQAAYEPEAFRRWNNIMSGTEVGNQIYSAALARGRSTLTEQEYLTIGNSLSEQLRKDNVWVVLMPLNVKAEMILNSLEANPDWKLVFYDDKQKLFVDTKTPQGRALFAGIADGTTKFPDEFSKKLTIAHNLLAQNTTLEAVKAGLENAAAALQLNPSQVAVMEVLSARKSFAPAVVLLCKQYIDNFIRNKKSYEKEDGYLNKIAVAAQADNFLIQVLRDEKERARYTEQLRSWYEEIGTINENNIW
jgi:hypothetical protein